MMPNKLSFPQDTHVNVRIARMKMSDKCIAALEFASQAHTGQVRKYTGESYIFHPMAVANIVGTTTDCEDILSAAYLHDVVEDCDVTIEEIEGKFGKRVAQMVSELTNTATYKDGNRAARVAINHARLSNASNGAKTIKLADSLHNMGSIVAHDPKFAKQYLSEKRALLPLLSGGSPALHKLASVFIECFFQSGK